MATGGCGRAPPIRGLAMVPTCVVYLDAVDVQIASTCRTCLGIGALAEERFCGVVAPLPPKDNLNRSPMSLVSNTSIAQTGPHLQDPASAAVHMLRSSRNRRSTASRPHGEPGPVKFCPPPACSQRTTLCLSCLLPSRTPVDRLLDRCRHQMLRYSCRTSALPLHYLCIRVQLLPRRWRHEAFAQEWTPPATAPWTFVPRRPVQHVAPAGPRA
jgi:hypothetical protein